MAIPFAAKAASSSLEDALARAIAAMGGREKLERVRALRWTGSARVETPGKPLLLEVETRVEPFLRARSRSWLAGKPETARTLIIEPDGGFVEREGKRTALPARQAEHERQQYGLYGYMLLVQAPMRDVRDLLVAERPGLPPAAFWLEGDYLVAADYSVASPDSDAPIKERFLLEGGIYDQGIRWPQTITILQNNKPYFTLDIETFSVELA